jgi:hypothetical protein
MDVTGALSLTTITKAHPTGIKHSDISACLLCAGSAMALMCGCINHTTIRMLGRWHINAILPYLHLQANPLVRQFAVTMFNHGTYSFLPTNTFPSGNY